MSDLIEPVYFKLKPGLPIPKSMREACHQVARDVIFYMHENANPSPKIMAETSEHFRENDTDFVSFVRMFNGSFVIVCACSNPQHAVFEDVVGFNASGSLISLMNTSEWKGPFIDLSMLLKWKPGPIGHTDNRHIIIASNDRHYVFHGTVATVGDGGLVSLNLYRMGLVAVLFVETGIVRLGREKWNLYEYDGNIHEFYTQLAIYEKNGKLDRTKMVEARSYLLNIAERLNNSQ